MFGRKLVDADVADWQFDQFEWLIDNFSSGPGLPDSELWQPIPEHFPKATGDLGPHIFSVVCQQCGFDAGSFDLIAVEPVKGEELGGLAFTHPSENSAAATYQIEEIDEAAVQETIHYDKGLSPLNLVATFAHELSHALFFRSYDAWPGDEELHELFTDLTAIYLGYGIFLSNTRFSFEGYSATGIQGWKASGSGYLPEADMIFGLALFMRIKGLSDDAAREHLKPKLSKMLSIAMRQLDRDRDRVEALRARVPAHIGKALQPS
jgi:hypothetical protein